MGVVKSYKSFFNGNKLTEYEIKFLLEVFKALETNKIVYSCNLSDLTFLKGSNKNKMFNTIKSGILKKPIVVITNDDKEIFCNWISGFTFEDNKIEYRIDKELLPHLLNIKKRFDLSDIEELLRLKHTYSFRIFELIRDNKYVLSKDTKIEVELEKLYQILDIPKSYQGSNPLKLKVLLPAINEISRYTKTEIDFYEKRIGRLIYSIVFIVKPKEE